MQGNLPRKRQETRAVGIYAWRERMRVQTFINNYNLWTLRRQKGRFFRGPLKLGRKFMPFNALQSLAGLRHKGKRLKFLGWRISIRKYLRNSEIEKRSQQFIILITKWILKKAILIIGFKS